MSSYQTGGEQGIRNGVIQVEFKDNMCEKEVRGDEGPVHMFTSHDSIIIYTSLLSPLLPFVYYHLLLFLFFPSRCFC